MKLTAIAMAMVVFANAPAFAVGVVQGCAVKDMGGYSTKVDATCTFDHQPGGNDQLIAPQLPATGFGS